MTQGLIINPLKFNYVIQKLRSYCLAQGLAESHPQNRLSILAACEDPNTIATMEYAGHKWPMPQTGQMWLEYDILTNVDCKGFFCVSTSYRNEPRPIKGRHDLVFPMFEFEIKGDFEELVKFCEGLVASLGFDSDNFHHGDYLDVAERYNTREIEHEHEQKLYEEYGPVFFLKNFPDYTSPFWNMKKYEGGKLAYKLDVIIGGMETIGSAERSCNVDQMRNDFLTISDGMYAKTLYQKLDQASVDKELQDYLSIPTITHTVRSGGGIGVTRLIKAMEKEGLLPASVLGTSSCAQESV